MISALLAHHFVDFICAIVHDDLECESVINQEVSWAFLWLLSPRGYCAWREQDPSREAHYYDHFLCWGHGKNTGDNSNILKCARRRFSVTKYVLHILKIGWMMDSCYVKFHFQDSNHRMPDAGLLLLGSHLTNCHDDWFSAQNNTPTRW